MAYMNQERKASVEALGEYLKIHSGKDIVVTYVTEYFLGDPMEQ